MMFFKMLNSTRDRGAPLMDIYCHVLTTIKKAPIWLSSSTVLIKHLYRTCASSSLVVVLIRFYITFSMALCVWYFRLIAL